MDLSAFLEGVLDLPAFLDAVRRQLGECFSVRTDQSKLLCRRRRRRRRRRSLSLPFSDH